MSEIDILATFNQLGNIFPNWFASTITGLICWMGISFMQAMSADVDKNYAQAGIHFRRGIRLALAILVLAATVPK